MGLKSMCKKNFSDLYRKYKKTPLNNYKRHEIYEEMVEEADTFDEWAIIHIYGDRNYQYLAEENMREKVLDGNDVQRNIIELFDLVTDPYEQEEILKNFLSKHRKEDDEAFVVYMAPWLMHLTSIGPDDVKNKEKKFRRWLRIQYS